MSSSSSGSSLERAGDNLLFVKLGVANARQSRHQGVVELLGQEFTVS